VITLHDLGEACLLAIHVLGGGVWIGAMVFSVFILQPRADAYFKRAADFEDFIFSVVHGARWKVFAGIVAILLSGVGLSVWPGHAIAAGNRLWMALYVGKLLAFAVAFGLFMYVSFVLWPKRTFATEDELPGIKRHFFRVGAVMVVANAVDMLLGIAAHVWR
jgi:uncharacterized membrane protein